MTWGTSTNPKDHALRTSTLFPLVGLFHPHDIFLCQSWFFGVSAPLFSFKPRIRKRLIFIYNIFLHTPIKPNSDSAERIYWKPVRNNGSTIILDTPSVFLVSITKFFHHMVRKNGSHEDQGIVACSALFWPSKATSGLIWQPKFHHTHESDPGSIC